MPPSIRSRFVSAVLLVGLLLAQGCAPRLKTRFAAEGLTVRTLVVSSSNVYVVDANGKRLMVDTGDVGDARRIEASLARERMDPRSIDAIVLTHGHADHAGNAAYFQATYGIRVIAGLGDRPLLAEGHNDLLCPTSFLAKALKSKYQSAKYEPLAADVWVEDELDLEPLLGVPGRVVAMPGHTPGSVVLLLGGKAFVGDLIRGGVLARSHPMLHFFMCDVEGNARNIRKLLENERIDTWYPGHFGPLAPDKIQKKFQEKKDSKP